jgi:hypothetical protein
VIGSETVSQSRHGGGERGAGRTGIATRQLRLAKRQAGLAYVSAVIGTACDLFGGLQRIGGKLLRSGRIACSQTLCR